MYGEDYDLWMRALASGYTHVATPERLYIYHLCVPGQKSENRAAGIGSAVGALGNLLESGLLNTEQQKLARSYIANYQANWALERQAIGLRHGVERVFGARLADPVLKAIHLISWMTRPLRRLTAGRIEDKRGR